MKSFSRCISRIWSHPSPTYSQSLSHIVTHSWRHNLPVVKFSENILITLLDLPAYFSPNYAPISGDGQVRHRRKSGQTRKLTAGTSTWHERVFDHSSEPTAEPQMTGKWGPDYPPAVTQKKMHLRGRKIQDTDNYNQSKVGNVYYLCS